MTGDSTAPDPRDSQIRCVDRSGTRGSAVFSKRLLPSAFAAVPWGVALTSPDGSFLDANLAYCRTVGHTLAKLQQADVLAITHVDERITTRRHIDSVSGGNATPVFWQSRYVRNDGEVVSVPVSVSAFSGCDGPPLLLLGILGDTSKCNAAVDALRSASALVEIAGRVALVGGWTIDLTDRKLVWSDVVAMIHDCPAGYSPSLARGLEYFIPEHRPVIREAVDRCIRDGTPYDLELEKTTASGRRIWVRSIGQAERNTDGTIVRIQGAFQDISSRKQNERTTVALAESLRVTLGSITDAFCTLDRDWRFTYVNPAAEDLFGQPARPLLGLHFWTELPQLVGTPSEDHLLHAGVSDVPVQFEYQDSRLGRWLSVTTYPSVNGLAIHLRDTSEARVTRRRLELLEVSVAHLNDIVMITEAAPLDAPGPRIQYVNEAFARITGFERDDVIGLSPRMLQGPLTDRAELDRIRVALARFEPVRSELLNYTKLGRPYWIEMDIVPVVLTGETYSHFVAIERDVTERKRAEQDRVDEDARLRLLHGLSDATNLMVEPAQVMIETAKQLGNYLNASLALYNEVTEPPTDSGEAIDSGNAADATVTLPLCRQGILRGTLSFSSSLRNWTSAELALIEKVTARSWDLAERLRIENELHESLSLLRMAGHTVRLGSWAADLREAKVYWSDEVCDILDTPRGTKSTIDAALSIYSPASRAQLTLAFARCSEKGTPFDIDLELQTAKGRDLLVRCTAEAQIDSSGVVKRVHGALQDITDRRKTQVALRSSLEEFRTLTEAMPQIVLMTQPDGSKTYANQQWTRAC